MLGAALFSIVTGCTSPSSETAKTGEPTKEQPKSAVSVGLVFDKGGLGDKSFNDSANRGLERAKASLGVKGTAVDSKSESEYQTNLEALAEQGTTLVIGVGISMKDAVEKAAKKYPNVKFALVDAEVDASNVRSLLFTEEQGSFLAGYLAGLMTTTNKIGFVGGMDLPLIRKFQYGYQAGALNANPKVEFLPAKFTGDWVNADLGKASAKALFAGGADIVYAAAGRAGLGVLSAAAEEKKFAIGVDSDQDEIEKGFVLTSMIKRVDVAVEETIKSVVDGKYASGVKVYDLAQDGVGLSEMKFTSEKIGPEKLAKVKEIAEKVKSGAIKVPTTEAEFKAMTSKPNP